MQKTTILPFLLCLAFGIPMQAQLPVESAPALRWYGTQYRRHLLLSKQPALRDDMDAIERHATGFRYFGHIDTPPVALVFHLMPLPGGAAPVSEADIEAQFGRLHTDFMAPEHPYLGSAYQHPGPLLDSAGMIAGSEADAQYYRSPADRLEGFAARAANPSIRFCRPLHDPGGAPSRGVITVSGTARVWNLEENDLFEAEKGGSPPWDPALYCNVWVARLPDSTAGFAQLPGGPGGSDGVVIDDRFFARAGTGHPYSGGKTLTHLLGSYLNLYELWDEYLPCADDRVDDTPIHNASNAGLPAYEYRHLSACAGNPAEMLSNLMDNSADSIQYLFTWGQVMRMQAALSPQGPRGKLRFTATACGDDGEWQNPADDRESGVNDTGVADNRLQMRIFPNPAAGQFVVEIESGAATGAALSVADALGKTLHRQSVRLYPGLNRVAVWLPEGHNGGLRVVTLTTGSRTLSGKVLWKE